MPNTVAEVNDIASTLGGEKRSKQVKEHGRRLQELLHTGQDHDFDINLCVKLAIPFIFTGMQRVKNGLFYKRKSVCFVYMYRWFI